MSIKNDGHYFCRAGGNRPDGLNEPVTIHPSPGDLHVVRMVLESQAEYDSQWAASCSIAPKIGCTPETLRVWVRQHERDTGGGDGGLTTAERQRLKELERENHRVGSLTAAACHGLQLPL